MNENFLLFPPLHLDHHGRISHPLLTLHLGSQSFNTPGGENSTNDQNNITDTPVAQTKPTVVTQTISPVLRYSTLTNAL